jgi:hypothetical protein
MKLTLNDLARLEQNAASGIHFAPPDLRSRITSPRAVSFYIFVKIRACDAPMMESIPSFFRD